MKEEQPHSGTYPGNPKPCQNPVADYERTGPTHARVIHCAQRHEVRLRSAGSRT
jgi:hypothetical protein